MTTTGPRPRERLAPSRLDATVRLPYYSNRPVATCWRPSWIGIRQPAGASSRPVHHSRWSRT